MPTDSNSSAGRGDLHRGLGLWQATSLNVANMVGIGPFITIPLFLAAMGGPQALVAWVLAAFLVLCDGLVWSELGAALPGSGGSYHFLTEIFGKTRWGRIVPFLFIWQFLISGTLELASGFLGGAKYLAYPFPDLDGFLRSWRIPGGLSSIAAATSLLVAVALCRKIRSLGWLSLVFCAGTLVTMLTVIIAGWKNFDSKLIEWPKNAFDFSNNPKLFAGLAASMTIAVYDYLGYYNICHLGDEVVKPGKTIPRAVVISIIVVALLYMTMNLAIIGVIPWSEAMNSKYIASEFMEKIFGRRVAELFTVLILWTVIAGVFSMMLGYSRIPFAAARNGHFFRVFGNLHGTDRFPVVSIICLGGLTAAFCYLDLQDVIDAAVIVRIFVQFIGQIIGLHWLRKKRPEVPLPFRMWLYPLPSLIALVGWIYIFANSQTQLQLIAVGILASGSLAYPLWKSKPFWRRCYIEVIAASTGKSFWLGAPFRLAFSGLAIVYGAFVDRRNRAFDTGARPIATALVPVISVGNITAGGTGKTPVAALIANWFASRGVKVCFVSRGYGAGEGELNDEALVLKSLCPQTPHLQNPDRVAAAGEAVAKWGSQLIILDDGFQHRRLARNLDLVLIDAANPWGYGHLLPRGLLREPIHSLSRADLVAITRVDSASRQTVDEIRHKISEFNADCPIIELAFPPVRLIGANGESAELSTLAGKSVVAFCGIGNPAAFRATIESLGAHVAAFQAFADHQHYGAREISDLQSLAASASSTLLICTQKDLVKLAGVEIAGCKIWAVEIGAKIVSGETEFATALQKVALSRADFE